MSEKCSKCATLINWLKHKVSGKPAPIEAEPNAQGNILVKGDQYRIAKQAEIEKAKAIGHQLFLNHFAGCPEAQSFRKDK